mgnify:CR=1 FL=1
MRANGWRDPEPRIAPQKRSGMTPRKRCGFGSICDRLDLPAELVEIEDALGEGVDVGLPRLHRQIPSSNGQDERELDVANDAICEIGGGWIIPSDESGSS